MALLLCLLVQADLVERALAEPDRGKRKEIAYKLRDMTIDRVEQAIRDGGAWTAPQKAGEVLTRTARTDVARVEFDYLVYVPENYDPAKPHRLLLSLHGWGDRGQSMIDVWLAQAKKEGDLFIVAPTSKNHIWAGPRAGHSHVLTALREVMRDFHISPDHVYLDGMSTGARGAFDIGAYHADRFAAIAPRSALPRTGFEGAGDDRDFKAKLIENYRALPVYWVFGSRDPAFVKGVLPDLRRQFEDGKYKAVLREQDAGHEWFADETPLVAKWLRENPRATYPKQVQIQSYEPVFARAYWIEIAQMTGTKTVSRTYNGMNGTHHETRREFAEPARVHATVEGNRIDIRTENVAKLTVRLHDRLVDLSKPVEITLNGKGAWNKPVERKIDVLLESAREYDRQMLFSAEVGLKVP